MWAIETAVAEFAALREEMAYRSRFQHLLINLNVVSGGALGGVALARPANEELLLLVAVISSSLGLLYADHSQSIVFLAHYIDKELIAPTGDQLFKWEARSRTYEKERRKAFSFRLSVFLVFAGPPVAALSYVPFLKNAFWSSPPRTIAWGLGAALTVLMGYSVLTTPLKPDEGTVRSGAGAEDTSAEGR